MNSFTVDSETATKLLTWGCRIAQATAAISSVGRVVTR